MSRYNERKAQGGATKPSKRQYAIPLESRGRYDVWSRAQSDAFRWNVAEVLCDRGGLDVDRNIDPYHWFISLPSPVWTAGPTATEVARCQLLALFSKDEDLRTDVDTTEVAWNSFQEAEAICKCTNDRIIDESLTVKDSDAACILHYAQWKIATILGPAPRLHELKPTFGPGAGVTCRKKTSARFKLSTPPSTSKSSLDVILPMVEGVRRWYQLHGTVKIVPGALEFVNKNWKTKRAIVIGATLNGMYQRALGRFMKERMLRHGIDLFEGQSIQRERARIASGSGGDATIDLQWASDLVAYMLVNIALPEDWVRLMDWLRDDTVTYRGTAIQLEKFSSMGCGFTFELESLLFYAISYGTARHYNVPIDSRSITVFGDDLIMPVSLARLVVQTLPKFGFRVNEAKSFLDGPFRESCGGDYVLGVDVRPFFIRHRMTHHSLVSFYNHMMRKPHQDPDRKIRDLILNTLPKRFQIFGPDGFGDGHLISAAPFETYAVPHKRCDGYGGYCFSTYIEIPKRDKTPLIGDVLLPAYVTSLSHDLKEKLNPSIQLLRGPYRDAFIRQILNDTDVPLDHYVLRKPEGARSKARKIQIYVLGPA